MLGIKVDKMILILAIIYLIVAFLAAILMHYSRPKIEIPLKSEEDEQIEKEVKEWLKG